MIIIGTSSQITRNAFLFILFTLVINVVDNWSVKLGKLCSKEHEVEKS